MGAIRLVDLGVSKNFVSCNVFAGNKNCLQVFPSLFLAMLDNMPLPTYRYCDILV